MGPRLRGGGDSAEAAQVVEEAVVVGLLYLLVWEALLGNLLGGVRYLSVTRWGAALVERLSDIDLGDDIGLVYALTATVVVVVGGTWLTGRRLRAFNLTGDE